MILFKIHIPPPSIPERACFPDTLMHNIYVDVDPYASNWVFTGSYSHLFGTCGALSAVLFLHTTVAEKGGGEPTTPQPQENANILNLI